VPLLLEGGLDGIEAPDVVEFRDDAMLRKLVEAADKLAIEGSLFFRI